LVTPASQHDIDRINESIGKLIDSLSGPDLPTTPDSMKATLTTLDLEELQHSMEAAGCEVALSNSFQNYFANYDAQKTAKIEKNLNKTPLVL
jgi:pyrrolidone-carboxylate peptidase